MSRIAIPSKDKINISEEFNSASFFLIFEIGNGVITNEEIRKNPVESNLNIALSENNSILFNLLCDCQIIICRKIPHELVTSFKGAGLQVLKTLEVNARKGIINMICR
jgi:predicted Fe-Mo cluster-binding NifX family protein